MAGHEADEHPAALANCFSRYISQSWMGRTFTKGNRQGLCDSDIPKVLQRDSTEELVDRLERYWNHEVKTSKKPSLRIPLIKAAGLRYYMHGILIILQLVARAALSILLGGLVSVFYRGLANNKMEGYIYASLLAACTIIDILCHHPLFFETLRTGLNLRVATSALIYRKALKLNQASLTFTNTGQIVNLVTNDVQRLDEVPIFFMYLFIGPFFVAAVCYYWWLEIGYSFFSGLIVLLLIIRSQAYMSKYFGLFRSRTANIRDERIKIMNEVICGMRVIKMYAWEKPFARLISGIRSKETAWVKKTTILNALNFSFYNAALPFITMSMFLTYIVTGETLSAEKVFIVIGLLNVVTIVTGIYIPRAISFMKECDVSLKRIQKFLKIPERESISRNKVEGEKPGVLVKSVYASWDKDCDKNTLTDINFEVLEGELVMVVGPVGSGKSSLLMALLCELPVTSGDICLSGEVAYVSQQPWVFSGTLKDNILFGQEYIEEKYHEVIRVCALEKDVEILVNGHETLVGERGVSLSGGQKARVNLARAVYREASIYIMDDPLSAVDANVGRHIFKECIRGVLKSKVCILVSHQLQFLSEADRLVLLREGKIVDYSSLDSLSEEGKEVLFSLENEDAEESDKAAPSMPNGDVECDVDDATSRSRLSRHLSYSPKNRKKYNHVKGNYDSRQSLHEMEHLIYHDGDLAMESRRRTKSALDLGQRHSANSAYMQPDIRFRPNDGVLSSVDLHPRALSYLSTGSMQCELDEIGIVEESQKDNEDVLGNRISWQAYKDYFRVGASPVVLLISFILFISGQVVAILCEWWLASWSEWEESQLGKTNSEMIIKEQRVKNISIFVALVVICFILAFVRATAFFYIMINASRNLHDNMFNTILRAPIYFFDTNPVGRILNRFSKDIGNMDDVLPLTFFDATHLSLFAAAIFLTTIATQPYVAVVFLPILVLFFFIRKYFLQTSRQIKRLEAFSRSPLYSHISATLQGLVTIRASEEQRTFLDSYVMYQNHNTSALLLFLCANRWLGFRLDVLCVTLITTVSFAPLLAFEAGLELSPVLVGLSLLYATRLTGMFQFCVRQSAEVENQMVSVERVQEYCSIEPEGELEVAERKPLDSWPDQGAISVQNMCLTYHSSLPDILKSVTFNIKAREKIGIVGRTGAGKSSLISALFRLVEPRGSLTIDGISITGLGLHDLRTKLSIIPQDPVIFAGTVRANLDPFSNHTDIELWQALQQVQLKEVVENFPNELEFKLAESGNNLSVGQRQLICLARAIIKHNKILIIDEATANVDYRTDLLIQEAIRTSFKDCTVLTIAHRLNTIMDADRIMVLDSGNVVEFDEPYELIQRPDSLFSAMVAQTGPDALAQLQKMAKIAHEKRSCQ